MTLVILALAWLLGIAAVALWEAPGWMAAAWVLAAMPAVWAVRGRRDAALIAVAALVALAGGVRFAGWADRDAPDLARYVGRDVTVEGVVDSEPDPGRASVRYTVRAETVALGKEAPIATGGKLLVTVNQYAEYLPGARLRIKGKLEQPPVFPDFDYRGYLARRGVVGTIGFGSVEVLADAPKWDARRLLADVRLRLDRALQRALPEPEASLAGGIAFGRDGNLPDALYADFRTTGLAHIVAVSGSNVALAAALAFVLLTPLVRRRFAIGAAFITVAGYVTIAGASASVVRAGIMAVVLLAGMALGRQQSALAALGAAAIVMTAFQPATALDLGFQLSLAATAGLIAFAPWIRAGLAAGARRARAEAIPELALQAVALSLSATVATLPIVWLNFGQVSLIGPLANVIVEPLFGLAFTLSAGTAVVGAMWPTGGWLLGLLAFYPLAATTWLAEHLADVPGAAVTVPSGGGTSAFVAYLVLAAAGWPAYRYLAPADAGARGIRLPPQQKLALAGGLAAAALVVVWRVSVQPMGGPGALVIDVLDVGQGDAILLTTPHGRQVLIDSGPSGIELARQLGAVLPHWDRTIDAFILTHGDEDHVGGAAAVLERYGIGGEIDNGTPRSGGSFAAYWQRANGRKEVRAGDEWTEDGVRFEVLWPPEGYETNQANNASIVLRVSYGSVSVLLTGDFDAAPQRALVALGDVRADVLKVPHHGSKNSAPDFFAAVGARLAVISVGADNPYGHPAPETLDALAGTRLLRTDRNGRVRLRIDGRQVAVSSER
ncbi:MAG: ComEC/Rec2 family competence protein [Chloroflexi bacterium]|nr:ComEC/Rec2 family competence protein [Chloroflexota bacterium]